jgi:DNA mismatch repair protein MutL
MQQLLFPEVLTLPTDEMVLLNTLLPDLKAIGFDLEQLSPDSYSVQGVPAELNGQSGEPVLQHILTIVRERGADAREEWQQQIALTLAESSAIPSGRHLSADEMRHMVEQLLALPQYSRTPDGKIIAALVSDEEIGKRF